MVPQQPAFGPGLHHQPSLPPGFGPRPYINSSGVGAALPLHHGSPIPMGIPVGVPVHLQNGPHSSGNAGAGGPVSNHAPMLVAYSAGAATAVDHMNAMQAGGADDIHPFNSWHSDHSGPRPSMPMLRENMAMAGANYHHQNLALGGPNHHQQPQNQALGGPNHRAHPDASMRMPRQNMGLGHPNHHPHSVALAEQSHHPHHNTMMPMSRQNVAFGGPNQHIQNMAFGGPNHHDPSMHMPRQSMGLGGSNHYSRPDAAAMPREDMVAIHHPHPGGPNQFAHPQTSSHSFPHQDHTAQPAHFVSPTSNVQLCDANGIAMGYPVMGMAMHVDGINTIPPAVVPQPLAMFHGQKSYRSSPAHRGSLASSEVQSQGSMSAFAADNHSWVDSPKSCQRPKIEKHNLPNGWQPRNAQRHDCHSSTHVNEHGWQSSSIQRGNHPEFTPSSENGRHGTAYSNIAAEPACHTDSCKGQELSNANRRQECLTNGACSQQECLPSCKVETHSANGAQFVKIDSSSTNSVKNECQRQSKGNYPESHDNARNKHELLQSNARANSFNVELRSQNFEQENLPFRNSNIESSDFGGRNIAVHKVKGERLAGNAPDRRQLRCDPCERSFTSAADLDAHLGTHIKCDEEGCTFEAIGRIIREHKVMEHGKVSAPTTSIGRRALALRSKESKEEIMCWREERKKNYPTRANVLRKMEERKLKKGWEEFLDEESQKRRQRLREVLEKQKALGCLVAEVPAYYLRPVRHDRSTRNKRSQDIKEEDTVRKAIELAGKEPGQDASERQDMVGMKRGSQTGDKHEIAQKEDEFCHKHQIKVTEEPPPHVPKVQDSSKMVEICTEKSDLEKIVSETSKNIKKRNNEASSQKPSRRAKRSKKQGDTDLVIRRGPSLLSKLLDSDIQKERSALLQCCRFIVNNAFLQQHPTVPLKHFDWIEAKSLDGDISDAEGTCADMSIDTQYVGNANGVQAPPEESNAEVASNPDGTSSLACPADDKVENRSLTVEESTEKWAPLQSDAAEEAVSRLKPAQEPFRASSLHTDSQCMQNAMFKADESADWKRSQHPFIREQTISDGSESYLNEQLEGVVSDTDISEEPFDVNTLFADSTDASLLVESKELVSVTEVLLQK